MWKNMTQLLGHTFRRGIERGLERFWENILTIALTSLVAIVLRIGFNFHLRADPALTPHDRINSRVSLSGSTSSENSIENQELRQSATDIPHTLSSSIPQQRI